MFKNTRLNSFFYLNVGLWLALVPLAVLLDIESVEAQITQADPNDTNTTIDSNVDNGITFTTVGGGTPSGLNLFHSFDEFNVNQNQRINFTVDGNIENVINRVTGGNVSEINGTITSPANFYLMNPAGIIFGNGAILNVNGAFTATTANGIGFGSDWFSASGTNNYPDLTGNPTAFGFTMEQPGGINVGNGNLNINGDLSLVAGTVFGNGLSANQVNITTVPGNSVVTLTEPGNPLSLEIPIPADSNRPNDFNPSSILSLPQLLTAGGGGNANRFTNNGDGTIRLSGSGVNENVANGDIAVGNISTNQRLRSLDENSAGDVSLNAEGNIFTGDINTEGSFFEQENFATGDAGNVTLNTGNNIIFNSINAQTLESSAGNVNLTAGGTIRGIGTIPGREDNTTISSGGANPGSISISHAGGADNIPFTVGDASENGTVADVRSGNSVIQSQAVYGGPVEFDVEPNGGSDTSRDGITITSVNSPPTLTVNQQINLSKTEPTTLTFEELNAIVDDADGDNTSIQIDEVTSGTLIVNGENVTEATSPITINPGDTLEYTPPANTIGDINGFVISASDGVSSSTPQTVGGTITNTPPTLESNPSIVTTDNQPAEFTFEDLKAIVTDADGDPTFVQLDGITSGTLRRSNGQVVTPGTTLSPGDTFEYIPPENASGNIPAFSISASDGFASSAPNAVGVTSVASQTIQPPEGESGNQGKVDAPFQAPKFPVNPLPPVSIDPVVFNIDNKFAADYESYLNFSKRERVSLVKAREILLKIEKAAGIKPAIIYANFNPITLDVASSQNKQLLKTNRLEVVLVTADGPPIYKTIQTANQEQILAEIKELHIRVRQSRNKKYKKHSQTLYNWIVAPLEQELETKGINNLLFITSEKLRSVPLATLHDGEKYLVEKYSVGFAPSLSLTDTTYKDIRNSQVLAMGTSEFQDDDPLPAVPQEVATIAQDIWKGKHYLNEDFTFNKLKSIRKTRPFGIIHLATHGYFTKGSPEDHYMKFWNQKLNFTEFRQLDLNNPSPVELLVFSACQTALGENDAELGFGGLAARTGAKTALASLWRVNDLATLGLMAEFYEQLKIVPVKSEALRKAQIAMIAGQIRVENGYLVTPSRKIPLPKDYKDVGNLTFQHPRFWSPFTMIGNPW